MELVEMNAVKSRWAIGKYFSGQYGSLVKTLRAKYNGLSHMEVEDIVSGLMEDMFSRADVTGEIENLGAYIYRAIFNRASNYMRWRKKLEPLDENEDGASYGQDGGMEYTGIKRRIEDALEKLPPEQRAVWVATEIEGWTFRELSEQWGVTTGALLARKHRATGALQKALRDLKK